jgi:hypothetical protein
MISKKNIINHLKRDKFESDIEFISVYCRKNIYTDDLIQAFLKSMKLDLVKSDYSSTEEYNEYIYGSGCCRSNVFKGFVAGKTQNMSN